MNYLKILKSKFVTKSDLQFYIVHKGRNSGFFNLFFVFIYIFMYEGNIYIYPT